MGSVMSLALALSRPSEIRGVVAHSGYLPEHPALNFQWERLEDAASMWRTEPRSRHPDPASASGTRPPTEQGADLDLPNTPRHAGARKASATLPGG
jgi:hypothetical protein